MVAMAAERDLLMGLLALQHGVVSREALLDALAEWRLEPQRSLSDILLDRKSLSTEQCTSLQQLVDECPINNADVAHVKDAGPGASAVLAALMATGQGDAAANGASHDNGLSAAPHPSAARYAVLRPHARGGLGQVSVALDRELNREVAVKELLDHAAASSEARARFLREAEVTSQLEHPGVVPVYGLGVGANGRQYYAMRLIKGTTLQQAIDQLHAKTAPPTETECRRRQRELLRRFITVCETMAFAHARGVIHRDVKPLNIMLGDYGETLIVDWGLAKTVVSGQWSVVSEDKNNEESKVESRRMADGTLSNAQLTQMGQMLGTPAYMSPEQASGQWDQLGPASDIFALGAMLYAILTGRPPFVGDRGQVMELSRTGSWVPARQINATAPLALDAVCRKAMAFDPTARYASAKELAAEIDRWLGDEPVTAWREPVLVRLGRWARRRRGWVAAASALLITSVIGLAIGLVAVDKERRQTVKQREMTQAAIDDMLAPEVLDSLVMQKELQPSQRKFLEGALKYYRELSSDASPDGEARGRQARVHSVVAQIYARVNDPAKAEAAYRDAMPMYERLVAEFPTNLNHRLGYALSQFGLGQLLVAQQRYEEAIVVYRDALPHFERLGDEHPKNAIVLNHLAGSYLVLGNVMKYVDRFGDAEPYYRKCIAVRERLIADHPDNDEYRRDLTRPHNNLALMYNSLGKPTEAEKELQNVLGIREGLVAKRPDNMEFKNDLAKGLVNLALGVFERNAHADAEAHYRQALALQEQVVTRYPGVPEYHGQLGAWHNDLGSILTKLERRTDAEAALRRAVAIFEQLVAGFPQDIRFPAELGRSCCHVGKLLIDADPEASLTWFSRGIDAVAPAFKKNPKNESNRTVLKTAREQKADALTRLKRFDEARAERDQAALLDQDQGTPMNPKH